VDEEQFLTVRWPRRRNHPPTLRQLIRQRLWDWTAAPRSNMAVWWPDPVPNFNNPIFGPSLQALRHPKVSAREEDVARVQSSLPFYAANKINGSHFYFEE